MRVTIEFDLDKEFNRYDAYMKAERYQDIIREFSQWLLSCGYSNEQVNYHGILSKWNELNGINKWKN